MIIHSSGIKITANENSCIRHITPDAEAWLTSVIAAKVTARREALIAEWRPRLFADDSVTELPADSTALSNLILARSDYRTRLQQDAAADPPIPVDRQATAKFNGTSRAGMTVRRPDRVPGDATVTLFASGITIDDADANCILAYIQDLEDWVLGALMGQVNRGKKTMIAKYEPIIRADPDVATMPATEDGLITMILARSDYERGG